MRQKNRLYPQALTLEVWFDSNLLPRFKYSKTNYCDMNFCAWKDQMFRSNVDIYEEFDLDFR